MGGRRLRQVRVLLATAATIAVCAASMIATAPATATVTRGACSGTARSPVVYLSTGRYVGYARFRITCTSERQLQASVQLWEQDPGTNPDDLVAALSSNQGFGGSWTVSVGETLNLKSPTARCNTELGPEELYSRARFRYRNSSDTAWIYSAFDYSVPGSYHCG